MKRQLADFLRPPHVYGSRTRVLLMAYFLVGLGIVFLAAILFTGHTARRMDRQADALTRIFSLFVSESAFSADQPGSRQVIRTVLREAGFPIIITDTNQIPIIWDGVGVLPASGDAPGELARPDLDVTDRRRLETLRALVRKFDEHNPPHPIAVDGVVQAHVHYGPSELSQRLRRVPFLLVLAMALFTSVGLLVFRYMKLGEQRSLWVGMARETAHQLGTPLTSLLGWVQLLENQEEEPQASSAGADRRQTYAEMQRDLERLTKVSARFSKIGSKPERVLVDVGEILRETAGYIERRIPHLGTSVRMTLDLETTLPVRGNRELLEWGFENLFKNAVDALENGGEIRVHSRHLAGERAVVVRISDNGKGIPPASRNRVWHPGYTTKRRGWGLGLVLVRRIVEEYHDGRIWIEDNPDRKGTCFVIRLPAGAAEPSAGRASERPPQRNPPGDRV